MMSLPRSLYCLPLELVTLQADGQFEMLNRNSLRIRGESEVEAGGVRIHHIPSVEVEKWLVSPTDRPAASSDLPRHCEGPRPSLPLPHTDLQSGLLQVLSNTLNQHLQADGNNPKVTTNFLTWKKVL